MLKIIILVVVTCVLHVAFRYLRRQSAEKTQLILSGIPKRGAVGRCANDGAREAAIRRDSTQSIAGLWLVQVAITGVGIYTVIFVL